MRRSQQCCQKAPSNWLSQCWPTSLTTCDLMINILRYTHIRRNIRFGLLAVDVLTISAQNLSLTCNGYLPSPLIIICADIASSVCVSRTIRKRPINIQQCLYDTITVCYLPVKVWWLSTATRSYLLYKRRVMALYCWFNETRTKWRAFCKGHCQMHCLE